MVVSTLRCAVVKSSLGCQTCSHEVAGLSLGHSSLHSYSEQVFTYLCASVTKQYNLVPDKGRGFPVDGT